MSETSEPSRKKTKKKPQNLSHGSKASKVSLQESNVPDNIKPVPNRKVSVLDGESCFRQTGMSQVNGGHPWCTAGEDSSSESFTHMNINCGANNNSSPESQCDYFRSAILDEVLNKKKMSLLQSPEVVKFLRDLQLKNRSEK